MYYNKNINFKMKINERILILSVFINILSPIISLSNKIDGQNIDNSVDILNKVDELMSENTIIHNNEKENISNLEIDLLMNDNKNSINITKKSINNYKSSNDNNNVKESRNENIDSKFINKIDKNNKNSVISKSSINFNTKTEDIISKNVYIGMNSPLEETWKFNVDEDRFIIPNEILNEDDWNKYLRIISILNSMNFSENLNLDNSKETYKLNTKNKTINNPPIIESEVVLESMHSINQDIILNPPDFA